MPPAVTAGVSAAAPYGYEFFVDVWSVTHYVICGVPCEQIVETMTSNLVITRLRGSFSVKGMRFCHTLDRIVGLVLSSLG